MSIASCALVLACWPCVKIIYNIQTTTRSVKRSSKRGTARMWRERERERDKWHTNTMSREVLGHDQPNSQCSESKWLHVVIFFHESKVYYVYSSEMISNLLEALKLKRFVCSVTNSWFSPFVVRMCLLFIQHRNNLQPMCYCVYLH